MRHSGIVLYVHIVWATWDRQPIITPEICPQLYRAVGAVCQEIDCQIIAIGGMPDHVHLLLRQAPQLALPDIVRRIKGNTSHFVTHEVKIPFFKWQGGYGAVSLSPSSVTKVTDYIKHQEQHHADKTLIATLEPSEVHIPQTS